MFRPKASARGHAAALVVVLCIFGCATGPSGNPGGPATGSYRVLRSGGWTGSAGFERCACRLLNSPTTARDSYGFRSVLSAGQP